MDVHNLNWGGPGYPAYEVEMKVSGGEKQAAAQTQQESQYLMNMMHVQFTAQTNLLNQVLIPQLKQMATNPQGFGAQALASMRAQTIGTIGTQLASQQKALAQQFATSNMAGVGSGAMGAISASLGASAAGAEASSLQELDIANAQLKSQQQQWGLGALGQATQLLGAAPQSAQLALAGSGQQFQQQQQMATQGGFWSNLLTGVLSSAAGGLTGGLGGLVTKGVGALGSLFSGGTSLPSATTGLGPASFAPGSQGAMLSSTLAGYQPAMPTLAGQSDSMGAL